METERAVLGAVLLSPSVLPTYTDLGIKPEHFADTFHGKVYEAALEVNDQGCEPDPLAVATKLGVELGEVETFTADTPPVANIRACGESLLEAHKWRNVGEAGSLLQLASERRESTLEARAMQLLAEPSPEDTRTLSPQQLAEAKFKSLNEGVTEAFPLPFFHLNKLMGGGIRRGEVALIGAWTSFGKTVFLLQTLSHLAERGLSCHVYINEMSSSQLVDRWLAGATGIAFYKIRSGDMSKEEMATVIEALGRIPFGVTDAADWTATDIARHIKANKWDVCGVDILHNIAHDDEKDMRNIGLALNQVTKPGLGDCALLATVHLNEARAMGAKLPRPVSRDIRQSGMLKNQADYVMFVHREQDDNGVPQEDGAIYFTKARNGELGGQDVRFNARRMEFAEKF